ncbi:MAG: phage tail tape measure protein [Clostridiales bacterium]|nr:phage tail tape measure protein [Clostridiales bacterium]
MEKDLLLNITGDTKKIIEEINGLQNTEVTIKLDGDFGDLMKDIQSSAKKMSTSFSKAFDGIDLSSLNKASHQMKAIEKVSANINAEQMKLASINKQIASEEKKYSADTSKAALANAKNSWKNATKDGYKITSKNVQEMQDYVKWYEKAQSLGGKPPKTFQDSGERFNYAEEYETATKALQKFYTTQKMAPPVGNLNQQKEAIESNIAALKEELDTLNQVQNQSKNLSSSNISIDPLKIEVDFSALDTLQSKISTINDSIANMQPIKIQEQKVDGNKGAGKGTSPSPKPQEDDALEANRKKLVNFSKSTIAKLNTAIKKNKYADSKDATDLIKKLNLGVVGNLADADKTIETLTQKSEKVISNLQNNHAIRAKSISDEAEKQKTLNKLYDDSLKQEKTYMNLKSKYNSGEKSEDNKLDLENAYKTRLQYSKEIEKLNQEGFYNSQKAYDLEQKKSALQKDYAQTMMKSAAPSEKPVSDSSYKRLYDGIEKYQGKQIDTRNLINTNGLNEALSTITKVKDEINKLSDNGKFTGSSKQFNDLNNSAKEAFQTIDKLTKVENQLVNKKGKLLSGFELGNSNDLAKLKQQMVEVAKATANGKVKIKEFNDTTKELKYTVTDNNNQVKQMKLVPDMDNNGFRQAVGTVKEQAGLISGMLDGIGTKFRSLFQYAVSSIGIYQVWGMFKQGIGVVKDFDTALTDLKKTSNGTAQDYANFTQTVQKSAPKIGTTSQVLTESAADWSRLGYSLDDSATMAKNTAVLMNVSEFENVSDATNSLISIMQAFHINADESMGLIDKLNNVGNNYAISTDEIASSLMRSSAALVAAGNSIDEAIALTASSNSIVQDPESVGAGLKTVSLRLRGTDSAKKELEESGEDVSDFTTNISKLQESLKELTKVESNSFEGFDILKDDGSYKSTYQILLGIGKIWKEIGEQQGDLAQAKVCLAA